MLFAVIFCLLFFNVVGPTFESYGLYEMGTTIFTGLVLGLQYKVAFLHNIWNKVHLISMLISIAGLFFTLFVLNASPNDNYGFYYVVNWLYQDGMYWFFGVFTIPLIMFLVDIFGWSYYVFFAPSQEMIFRENCMGLKPAVLKVEW
jgi:hypothetical protein